VLGCQSDAVAPYAPVAVAALDALEGGHTAAAQALVGSLIDSLLTGYFGKARNNFIPNRKGTRTTSAYDEFTVREFITFAPCGRPISSSGWRMATAFRRPSVATPRPIP
jgi:hypothetical protein